jgi:hypothetical protein
LRNAKVNTINFSLTSVFVAVLVLAVFLLGYRLGMNENQLVKKRLEANNKELTKAMFEKICCQTFLDWQREMFIRQECTVLLGLETERSSFDQKQLVWEYYIDLQDNSRRLVPEDLSKSFRDVVSARSEVLLKTFGCELDSHIVSTNSEEHGLQWKISVATLEGVGSKKSAE